MNRKLLAAFLAGAAIVALAGTLWAQVTGLLPTSLTNNETWQVGLQGPGGTSEYVTTGIMRNSVTMTNQALAAPFQMPRWTGNICITAQPASGANITLDTTPFDGQIFEAINCTASAFVTNVFSIVPSGSQTLLGGNIALTTLATGASRELRYSLATNTWYPVR